MNIEMDVDMNVEMYVEMNVKTDAKMNVEMNVEIMNVEMNVEMNVAVDVEMTIKVDVEINIESMHFTPYLEVPVEAREDQWVVSLVTLCGTVIGAVLLAWVTATSETVVAVVEEGGAKKKWT